MPKAELGSEGWGEVVARAVDAVKAGALDAALRPHVDEVEGPYATLGIAAGSSRGAARLPATDEGMPSRPVPLRARGRASACRGQGPGDQPCLRAAARDGRPSGGPTRGPEAEGELVSAVIRIETDAQLARLLRSCREQRSGTEIVVVGELSQRLSKGFDAWHK